MKIIKHEFSGGYGDWQAMLPASFENSYMLVKMLKNASWQPGIWEGKEVIPFILVGDRTWDLSTEEMEELGYDGFEKKYPYGKHLHQPGANGEEFRDILHWGAMINTEHQITENPKNGGGNTYRIVSPKMKEILEQFHLPPHRFYPAEVTHEITGEQRPYYLFHLTRETGTYLENAFWPMMKTIVIKEGRYDESKMKRKKNILVKQFDLGSFEDFEDYKRKVSFAKRDHAGVDIDKKLDLEKEEDYNIWKKIRDYRTHQPFFVFNEPYDLLWMGTEMLISDELKEALDKAFPNKKWYYEREDDDIKVITGYQPGEELPF